MILDYCLVFMILFLYLILFHYILLFMNPSSHSFLFNCIALHSFLFLLHNNAHNIALSSLAVLASVILFRLDFVFLAPPLI